MDMIDARMMKRVERQLISVDRKFGGAQQVTNHLSSLNPTKQFGKKNPANWRGNL